MIEFTMQQRQSAVKPKGAVCAGGELKARKMQHDVQCFNRTRFLKTNFRNGCLRLAAANL